MNEGLTSLLVGTDGAVRKQWPGQQETVATVPLPTGRDSMRSCVLASSAANLTSGGYEVNWPRLDGGPKS